MTTETITLSYPTRTSNSPDKQRGSLKTKRDELDPGHRLPKPDWIRVKAAMPSGRFVDIKDIVRANKLVTVCEEASCPNIGECWSKGTATFMIMGDKCTRRCRCSGQVFSDSSLDFSDVDSRSKALGDMLPSFECNLVAL